ncbi:MAG: SGNH/GDSL hydrolase family protein, partial [Candidatus Binatia bacterium]
GWTTSNLLGSIEREKPTGSYDLVSVLIGVNDQVRGLSADLYREKFITLLERAITLAGQKPARVLVLSLPDWSMAPIARNQDPEAIKAEIDNFNRVNRAEAEQRGVHYIDVTPSSRRAAQDRTLLAKDQLHPSGQMYADWARLALPAACQALTGK